MHCELVVPGLLAAAQGLRLPAAELLAARSRRRFGERRTVEGWLEHAFGLEGPLPAGALTMLARGAHGEGNWARADPVHLRLMRDHLVLLPGEALSVSREDAEALSSALNRHFAGRLELHAPEPLRWTARLAEPLELPQEPPLEHTGTVVRPGGPAAPLVNEMQMVLHAHPVNEAREARGEPTINSLWLWGAGSAPLGADSRWQSVSADDPVALGLAQVAKTRGRALPASADAWLERLPEDGRQLVLLDGLRAPLALGNAATAAAALEETWFAPLLAALRSGRIGMVTVHVPDSGVSFETIRGDLRRFWRVRRPLAGHETNKQ